MIERIKNSLLPHWGKRLFVLYGSGLEDAFIDEHLQELEIEKALVDELRANGYERIVFSSPHNSIYFNDERSELLSRPSRKHAENLPPSQMHRLDNGPFNTLMLFSPQNFQKIESPLSSMGDMGTIRLLNTLMNSSDYRTAVVIVQAEALLCQFDDPRILSGLIGSWARLPSGNENCCFFLFAADRYEQLLEGCNQLPIPELRAAIHQNSEKSNRHAVVRIEGPTVEEIDRLLAYARSDLNLPVETNDMKQIRDWMTVESISVRQWLIRLKNIPRLDKDNTRQRSWFSGNLAGESSPEVQLQNLVGLDGIKQRMLETSAWISMKQSSNIEFPTMHMIFSGNPGTGKTTVARLFGELLRNIGVLKRGHLVEATGSDLVGDVVGATAIKTGRVIDSAIDGVLFIDEAYTLNEPDRGSYGQEAIETLLPRLESDRSRLVVILAGYPGRMKKFLDSNPGLSRRFPAENILIFPDYSPMELWQILAQMLQNLEIPLNQKSEQALKQVIAGLHIQRDEQFGNAGEMRNLAEALDRRRAVRIYNSRVARTELTKSPVEIEDIPPTYSVFLNKEIPPIESVIGELDVLIGLPDVKEYIGKLISRLRYENLRKIKNPSFDSGSMLQHLVFTGNPGTGKTTVARLIGKMYRSLGLLKKGHCVEVSRVDLVAGYVGQTAIQTREKIKEALDGVLFIDEAYSLNNGGESDFGREAVDTLVKMMEDNRERLVVIVAGYTDPMDYFLKSNPGLRSRFTMPVNFHNFKSDELKEILKRLASQEGFTLDDLVAEKAEKYLENQKKVELGNFGNARSVLSLFTQMKSCLAKRIIEDPVYVDSASDDDLFQTFIVNDVPVYKEILKDNASLSTCFSTDNRQTQSATTKRESGKSMIAPESWVSNSVIQ